MGEWEAQSNGQRLTTNHQPLATVQFLLLARSRLRCSAAVFLQLIMQGFQADSEDFSRPCLVVAGGLQGLEDQQLFRFPNGCAHPQADAVRIAGRGAQRSMSEAGWQ